MAAKTKPSLVRAHQAWCRSARAAVGSPRDLCITLRRRARHQPSPCTRAGQGFGDTRAVSRAETDVRSDEPAASERLPEVGFETIPVPARSLERRAVVQHHDVLAVEERLELSHLLHIHDGRSVDSQKTRGIELALEVTHRLPE